MLSALLLVPPLVLIATLVVSAVAKLLDPRDTSSVFSQLRLPRILLRLRVPRLLPYGELVLVALLLFAPDGWYVVAGTATLALFAAYFGVILRALRLPYPVTCACFGRLGLGEVTRQTLARNAVLLALALMTWVASLGAFGARIDGGVVHQWIALTGAAAWLTGLAIVALSVAFVVSVVVAATRRVRDPASADDPDGYRPTPTPEGVLQGADGPVSLHALTDTAARLLVFCDPEADAELVRRAAGWADRLAPVRVHVVVEGSADGDRLGDPDGLLRARFGMASPAAVLLGTDRMLAGGPAVGEPDIADLVEAVAVELGATPSG